MVIDTSAALAWLKNEAGRERIVAALEAHPVRRMSAVSLLEAHIVVRAREHPAMVGKLHLFLEEIDAVIMPFDEAQAVLADAASSNMARAKAIPPNSTSAIARSMRWPSLCGSRFCSSETILRKPMLSNADRLTARKALGYPRVAIRLDNLAQLLQPGDRLAEAEPSMRRAGHFGGELGAEHPSMKTVRGSQFACTRSKATAGGEGAGAKR